MSINKIRSLLYKTASLLGDFQAVQKGKLGQRLIRKAAGRTFGKLMNKLFK